MKPSDALTVPVRYLPTNLTPADKQRQKRMLVKSRRKYDQGQYVSRQRIKSFNSRTSKHMNRARELYHVDTISPNKSLARATGCTVDALRKIVSKGEGAYFSSGSRPNQTAQSWGMARLASAITGQKAAAVDYHILELGCNHRKKAFILAKQSRKKHGFGQRSTRKVTV